MKKNNPKNNKHDTLDWKTIHERISQTSKSLSDMAENNPEVLERIWARRATQLEKVMTQVDESDERIQLAFFQLGWEIFAIDAQFVSTIRLATQVTYMPRTPKWVAGVTNLRGRILSVLDFQKFFDLPNPTPQESKEDQTTSSTHYLMVVETPDIEIACLADKVFGVEAIPINQVKDNTNIVHGIPPEFVMGVVEYQSRISYQSGNNPEGGVPSLVVILNLIALLAQKQLIVHEEIV
jgi:purine-binding chemotaxis protein CheW